MRTSTPYERAARYGGQVLKALFCSMLLFIAIAALGLWLQRRRRDGAR
jgi:uncharacterized iron-regulated membrane protein